MILFYILDNILIKKVKNQSVLTRPITTEVIGSLGINYYYFILTPFKYNI